MSNAKKYTPAEAQAWVESREWANGWNINTDSTVNAVEFANQYAANKRAMGQALYIPCRK